jgi:putative addiction module component (TIGR02574 family)
MALSVEQLAEHAMELSAESRARLADILVESLDYEPPTEIEKSWLREANRRLDAYRRGESRTIAGEEVLRRARELLTS